MNDIYADQMVQKGIMLGKIKVMPTFQQSCSIGKRGRPYIKPTENLEVKKNENYP